MTDAVLHADNLLDRENARRFDPVFLADVDNAVFMTIMFLMLYTRFVIGRKSSPRLESRS